MPKDMGHLGRYLRTVAINMPGKADEMVRKVAMAVDQVLVTETPVATGRARSNWIPSLSVPAVSERPSIGLGPAALLAETESVLRAYQSEVHGAVHFTNNVVYINRLNQGWSKQAPAGFVQRAIMKGTGAIFGVSLID